MAQTLAHDFHHSSQTTSKTTIGGVKCSPVRSSSGVDLQVPRKAHCHKQKGLKQLLERVVETVHCQAPGCLEARKQNRWPMPRHWFDSVALTCFGHELQVQVGLAHSKLSAIPRQSQLSTYTSVIISHCVCLYTLECVQHREPLAMNQIEDGAANSKTMDSTTGWAADTAEAFKKQNSRSFVRRSGHDTLAHLAALQPDLEGSRSKSGGHHRGDRERDSESKVELIALPSRWTLKTKNVARCIPVGNCHPGGSRRETDGTLQPFKWRKD